MDDTEKKKRGYVAFPSDVPEVAAMADGAPAGARVPWVHEEECVGCNLCQLVCPVEGTISMVEQRKAPESITWNERIANGTDVTVGMLEATRAARGLPEE